MGKFWKWLGVMIVLTIATFGIALIVWGVITLIRKVRDS